MHILIKIESYVLQRLLLGDELRVVVYLDHFDFLDFRSSL